MKTEDERLAAPFILLNGWSKADNDTSIGGERRSSKSPASSDEKPTPTHAHLPGKPEH
jgi:hypothetical protein